MISFDLLHRHIHEALNRNFSNNLSNNLFSEPNTPRKKLHVYKRQLATYLFFLRWRRWLSSFSPFCRRIRDVSLPPLGRWFRHKLLRCSKRHRNVFDLRHLNLHLNVLYFWDELLNCPHFYCLISLLPNKICSQLLITLNLCPLPDNSLITLNLCPTLTQNTETSRLIIFIV